MTIDSRKVRSEFPFFRKGLIYLDTSATSQKPKSVIEAMRSFYENSNANVHRGVYGLAEEATQLYEGARKKVADFIGARPKEIIFVRNATEAINIVARSWGDSNIQQGDRVLITEMEHHSNIVPWQLLIKRKNANLACVQITKSGELDMSSIDNELKKKPKIFAFTHVSNVLGTVNPAKSVTKKAHSAGALVLLDASQSVPHMLINVKDLDCDFLVFSGHKLFGPFVGVLYAKQEILEKMEPFLTGGDMIKEVTIKSAAWNGLPWKFEAGTPNIEGAVGLGAAIDYVQNLGMSNIQKYEEFLTKYALKKLQREKSVKIYGSSKNRAGVISFNVADIHAHDVSTVLDECNLCVRSGHHCAQPLMNCLGIPACVRISFGPYNTKEDVDAFMKGLEKVKKVFKL